MAKARTIYICQNCGAESSKWLGKCSSCNQWNTFVEEVVKKEPVTRGASVSSVLSSRPLKLDEITYVKGERIDSFYEEFNRVLGGGFVKGSLVLVGGEPGIGKSTLALQTALSIRNYKTLYASGEESLQQIKLRADRLELQSEDCYFMNETSLETILNECETAKPDLLIIDSIQTISSEVIEASVGSVSQVRECTSALLRYAKRSHTTIVLIGHINKEGNLAGPKTLEHIVDVVLQFEGDNNHSYRMLRSLKNRFGSTSEIGIFEMQSTGLVQIANPSDILISPNDEKLSGISIGVTMDGVRPFLIEVQALVSTAAYGTPQRSATGFDTRRLNMLLAVLEKRAGFHLISKDVFLNITGGIRIDDPAIDMAVVSAILSSNFDRYINHKYCVCGEVGLSGEIRPVSRVEQRIREAEKLGFQTIFISKSGLKNFDPSRYQIEVFPVGKIEHLVKAIFH
jgi:DNA repair protein RadA/Sms